MTQRQIELIENSWGDFIMLNPSEAGLHFYDRLFEMNPNLRSLFKGDLKAQARKLTSMITFLVHKLNNLDEVSNDVKALGERHKSYMVKAEHYPLVGSALLWTLAQGLGDQWNEELEEAWANLYDVLSGIMLSADREAVK